MRQNTIYTRIGIALLLTGVAGMAKAQTPPAPQPPLKQPEKEAKGIKPGHDRWAVKTGGDADAGLVVRKPVKTTVEKLLALPRPASFPLGESLPELQDHRVQPVETTVYTVEADIVEFRAMPDGDYRVVIEGASGKQMILEMPHPGSEFIAPSSAFVKEITKAREQFDTKMNPLNGPKPPRAHARITGIGFFGRNYNAKVPVTGNLIQLHPVLNIQWLDKPTHEFTADTKKVP